MKMTYDLSIKEESGILYFQVTGKITMETGISMLKEIVDETVKRQFKKILVDITDMTGSLKTLEQYELPKLIPEEFKKVKIAMIDKEEDKNIWKYFETSVRNKGYNMLTFIDIDDAKKWLLQSGYSV